MVQRYFTFLTFFTLSPLLLLSQLGKPEVDYKEVDSFAKTVRYKGDIHQLGYQLTKPYNTSILKARAIFIWITDNIAYDYKSFNKQKEIKGPKCKEGMNCDLILAEWEEHYLKKVIRKRKGVCDAYARLFKKMCDLAGLKSEYIEGYTRTKPYQVGSAGVVNHAWNAIYLDSAYYLLDATWASGGCAEDEDEGKLLYFEKRFNEYYWLTPSKDFIRDHYPKEGKWVFETNYTKEKFAANPYYESEIIPKIQLLSPKSGVLKVKKGDTLHFRFDYIGRLHKIQINSNVFRNRSIWQWKQISRRKKIPVIDSTGLRKQQYVPYRREGNRFDFNYIILDESLYYLDILFDYNRVMRFKIQIDK